MSPTTSRRTTPLFAALCVALLAGRAAARGAPVDAATAEQAATASEKYRAGNEAFEAGRYEESLQLFRASYDVVASPNSHLMIARALSKLGSNAEAFAEIESTIVEADAAATRSDKYKKTAQTARAERADLSRKIAFVVATVPAAVLAGAARLESPELGRLVVNPGHVEVKLRLPGGAEVQRPVDVAAGETARVELPLPEAPAIAPAASLPRAECPPASPPEPRRGIDQRTLAYVTGGIGVAGFATFAVFGLLNEGAYRDLQDRCPGGVCPAELSGDAETGRTYQTLANVGLGVGIAGLVTGAALFFTSPPRAALAVTPPTTRVAVGPGRVTLEGRF